MNFKIEEIKEKVNNAVNLLLKNDIFLLTNDANERTIMHKCAQYLDQEFPEWDVDCEYNRKGSAKKTLPLGNQNTTWDDTDAQSVFPDIIIHHRNNKDNLLVIEIKKSSSKVNKIIDIKKLNKFTTNSEYLYEYGLFILFYTEDIFKNNPKLEWYKNGRKLENE